MRERKRQLSPAPKPDPKPDHHLFRVCAFSNQTYL